MANHYEVCECYVARYRPLAWSDIDNMRRSYNGQRVAITERGGFIEYFGEFIVPRKFRDHIVCLVDGRTLLNRDTLSDRERSLIGHAIRHERLWITVLSYEIPSKYIDDILRKYFLRRFDHPELILEKHFSTFYKKWLFWQQPHIDTTFWGLIEFSGVHDVKMIICYKSEVKVVFDNHMCTFSLTRLNRTCWKEKIDNRMPNSQHNAIAIDARQAQSNGNRGGRGYGFWSSPNVIPAHYYFADIHPRQRDYYLYVELKYVDTDAEVIRSWRDWHLDNGTAVPMKPSPTKFNITLYTSEKHRWVIGRICDITVFRDTYENSERCILNWINPKYGQATAVHIYTNVLFVGTEKGFLLAYRMQDNHDLWYPKKRNLLFAQQQDIGKITKLNILDWSTAVVIVVASTSEVVFLEMNENVL